ncbi:MAG: hypothetical protein ACI93L_002314, partial [Cyclobacteriaceae bacterium]
MKVISIKDTRNRSLSYLESQLKEQSGQELVLIARSEYNFQTDESHFITAFEKSKADVIFPATADFPFDVKGLNLYYWKY